MKNSQRFFAVCFILMIVFAFNSCTSKKRASTPDRKHYVILLVDVNKITPGSKARDFCSFPDGYPYPNDSIENYTTDVLPGDSIVWIGVSTSNPVEDTVMIEMINHRSGDNVLGPPQGNNGIVQGIININARPGQKEKYAIHFKVIKEGIPPRTYILDPKILVH